MAAQNQVDLFLLGKTGHGKSSTGNAILGREVFQVSDSSNSETFQIQVGWSRRQDRVIKVLDGPGLMETRMDRAKAANKITEDMKRGILLCSEGFHAMVIVLKYGGRFTEEELETVNMLKDMFGQNFVREFCILIFTHGELFDMNNWKTPQKTFADWCREQTGPLQAMLMECSNRAVLFYNRTPARSDSQLQELLSLVDNLSSRGVRYTNELFEQAAKTREQLIVRENAPQLKESIQARVNLIMDGLEKLRAVTELNDDVLRVVNELKQDARELATDIVVQDKGTGVLDSLKQVVANLLQNIDSHEEALKERGNKQKMEKALAEAQDKFDRRLAELQEEYEKAKDKDCCIVM